jgi:hypothetical protein
MLIDDNYSFILAEWANNKIEGPFFVIYPDESILYGTIKNDNIDEVVCYQVNKEFNMIVSKANNILIMDMLEGKSILIFQLEKGLLEEATLNRFLDLLED